MKDPRADRGLFWGADVVRGGARVPLLGTAPIENDAIVAPETGLLSWR